MANITAVSKSFVHERHSIFVGKKTCPKFKLLYECNIVEIVIVGS